MRLLAYGFGLPLAVLACWPAFREPPVDSFPLSNYPMFSKKRGRLQLDQVIGVGSAGVRPLPPRAVANEEVMQALVLIRRAVRGGPREAAALCRRVARNVAPLPEFSDLRQIQVVTAQYEPLRYFAGSTQPESFRPHATCNVSRSSAQ